MYGRRWLLTVARIATIAAAIGGFASLTALAQSQSQPAAAAHAAMLVAVAADPQKPAVSLGSVVWSTIPPAPGQPATVAVKAEADIPNLKMHAVMTLRKNTDPSLSASHTIDLRITFADGAEIKGIKDLRMPMMRRDDPPAQDSLAGARVKISDSYFLVGLNRADADAARNLDLIASRGWFDFPLLLNDDRIAKLTFEKGPDGDRILTAALAAWTAQPQVPEPQPTPAAQAAPPSPTAPSPKQVPSVTPTTVTSSGGEDCSTVTDPTQRLACYDRVSASPAAPSIALPTPARSNVPATPTDAETRDDEPVQNLADYLGVWVEFQEDRGWNITLVPKQESLTVNKISVNRGNCHSQYDDKINFPLRIKLGTKVSYHVLDFCNILEIEVVTDHGPGIFYYKTDDLIRSGVSLEKTYSRTGVRDTTTNFYAIDVTFYTIAVTSRVDNIIIRSITANDGTCIPLQKRQSLPVSLKFGEKYLVSFADCDPIQINVATDIGSTVFTWNQR